MALVAGAAVLHRRRLSILRRTSRPECSGGDVRPSRVAAFWHFPCGLQRAHFLRTRDGRRARARRLGTQSMTARRGPRPPAPGITRNAETEEMIRVDHAGEYGARRIYQGQIAILGALSPDAKALASIRRMAEQEQRHLERFDRLVNERRVRPTALAPLWDVAAFALGAATALLGPRAAMACTAAVEEVIDRHYASQLERLDADPELKSAVAKF